MNPIYASKLYRCSPRKERIQAALANPVNKELVTQLSSYLDDQFQDIVTRQHQGDPASHQTTSTGEQSPEDDESTISSTHNSNPSHPSAMPAGRPSASSLSDKFAELDTPTADTDNLSGPDDTSDNDMDADVSDDLQEIDESTNITAEVSIEDDAIAIKDLLNATDTTDGINRVLVRDNELWIHYNDSVNLNTVMGPVIETLYQKGYTYLAFNRLARSDNAMVFQIDLESPTLGDGGVVDDQTTTDI